MRHERHEALLSVTMRHERHVCVTLRHEASRDTNKKASKASRCVTKRRALRKRHEALRCVTERHDIKRHERHEGGIHDLAVLLGVKFCNLLCRLVAKWPLLFLK